MKQHRPHHSRDQQGSNQVRPPAVKERMQSAGKEKMRPGQAELERRSKMDMDQEDPHMAESPGEPLPPTPPHSSFYIDKKHTFASPKYSPPVPSRVIPPPRVPQRKTPGPVVQRDLKPGRKQELHSEARTAHQDIGVNLKVENLRIQALSRSGEKSLAMKNRQSVELPRHAGAGMGRPLTPPRFSQDLEFPDANPRFPRPSERHFRVKATPHRMQESHEWMRVQDDIDVHRRVPCSRPAKMSSEQNWYIGPCQRAKTENALHLANQNGVFVVRDHSRSTEEEPFVLAVMQDNRVYNIKIRFIKSTHKFALGTGLRMNDMFDSVDDIIKFHMIFPIHLINGKDLSDHQRRCLLTRPLTREEMIQLLD
ncbi:cytokine-dependent hematopoietic cell linker isoform X2 [Brienomyrus brachyistius]|nr:cytokine-dependent hematopoietic cell linker isoform X2 [Brienomyrus brachyistius]